MVFLFSPAKRAYLSQSLYFVRRMQDPTLPSCESIFEEVISTSLRKTQSQSLPNPYNKAAETSVYRIALDLVDSARYRNVFGNLNPTGEQLLRICRNCLNYFLEVEYITKSEFDEHSDFLLSCDLEFERYGLYK